MGREGGVGREDGGTVSSSVGKPPNSLWGHVVYDALSISAEEREVVGGGGGGREGGLWRWGKGGGLGDSRRRVVQTFRPLVSVV